ncbi:hypothetical protein ACWEQ0_26490, partial [Nocardia thailandica]
MVSGRRSWVLLVAVALAALAIMGVAGGNDSAGRAPDSLPVTAESARAAAELGTFPDAGTAVAILVVSRADGAPLAADDRAAGHRCDTATRDRRMQGLPVG